jgi:hypothetical protein
MEPRETMLAYLGKLANELESHGFATELISKVSKPSLKVANAETLSLNERVLCQQADDGSWSFWWPWHQPIGPVDDLDTVVGKIVAVLRSVGADG